ncbi:MULTISPECIES: hypothetical protein [Cupriavidus]
MKRISGIGVLTALFGVAAILCGCAPARQVIPPDVPTARVRFRLEYPAAQYVYDAVPNECYLPTDSTGDQITSVRYSPDAMRWVREASLQRIGMPAEAAVPPESYAEAFVIAGKPVSLRLLVFGASAASVSSQVTFTFQPGKDYEVLTDHRSGSGYGLNVSVFEIVRSGDAFRTVPVKGIVRVPSC